MTLENNILSPSYGKVLIRKRDGLVREGKFKLGRGEGKGDYFEGVAFDIRGKQIGILVPNSPSEAITSLIRTRYSLDEELALINNHNYDLSHEEEYNEFLQFRQDCKTAVKEYFKK